MGVLRDLFGAGTWGAGGNIIAAAILAVPGYLLRGRLGRALAKHIAPRVATHVAEHLAAQAPGIIQADRVLTEAEAADLAAKFKAAQSRGGARP